MPWIMADDFQCTDTNPVKAVRWWGSYIGVVTPRTNSVGFTVSLDISFHLSTGTHPASKLRTLLLLESALAQEVFVGYDQTGDAVYRCDAYLPVEFDQVMGTEYFLNIDKPSGENWGWHDADGSHPIGDYAAYSLGDQSGPWYTEPAKTDLAF